MTRQSALRQAYTLGRLTKQPSGKWELTHVGFYSDGPFGITTDYSRHRYVELLPPTEGATFGEASQNAEDNWRKYVEVTGLFADLKGVHQP